MEVISGKVGKIKFTNGLRIAVMVLDTQPVELSVDQAIHINNGDSIIVCGVIRKGKFYAKAYRNLSNNVSGSSSKLSLYFIGVFFTLIGLGFILSIGIIFILLGIAIIATGYKNGKAYDIICQTNPK